MTKTTEINSPPTPEAVARSEANSSNAEKSHDNVEKAHKSNITKDPASLRLELLRIIAPLGGNTNLVNRTEVAYQYVVNGTVNPDT